MSAKNTVTIRKHALYALLAVLAAGLMFAMVAVPATAHAEKGTPYKYTVRVLAGNQGTVDGGIWETTVEGGGQVVLGNSNPQVLDVDNPLASQAAADKSGESADKSGDSAGKTDTEKKTDGESGGGFPIAAIYGIAAALVAAIAVVLFMLKRRRDAQYDDIFDDKTQ